MTSYQPPYRAALAGFFAVFTLYALTLAPTTALWDASEYITTAFILGIPHPPGNPLFVAVAKVWTLLLAPTGLSVAIRVNLLAAATSAGASALLFLVAHRVISGITEEPGVRLAGAATSLILGATAFTVWNQSTVNEKVYTVSVFIMALATWLLVRWYDRRDDPGSLKLLILAGYLLVLGSTNHLMSVLAGPAMLVLLLITAPRVLLRSSFWVRAIPVVFLGLSFNLMLPIRADQRPVINEGDPVCASLLDAGRTVFTNGKSAACPALADVLNRVQYQKPPISERQAPLKDQLLNYFQYFDWQWSRGLDPSEVPGNARLPFSFGFIALGLLGLWLTWRSDHRLFVYLMVLTGTLTVGLVLYLNFKYGYSLAPEVTERSLHEVRERDYFFVASFIFWGFLSGLGLVAAWGLLSGDGLGRGEPAPTRRWWVTAPILLVALLPMVFNWGWASRRGDYAARDWAYNLLMSVEPYGVLFTNGDNDTFPLWYLQDVEGLRRDVTVIVVQYLHTDWYPKQLQELTVPDRQRAFNPADTGTLYPDREPPSRPVTAASHEEMDRVRGGVVGADFTVPIGPIAVAYPEGTTFNRAQLLALAMIRDSFSERPIYFASKAGLMSGLGLSPWGVRQGVLYKLNPGDPEETALESGWVQNTPKMGNDWWDLERSLTLTREVYSYRGLRDRAVWADRATLNIPWHFYALHLQLADALEVAGGTRNEVEALINAGEAFGIVSQGGYRGIPARSGN